jgi:8-oxo-dGTP diphosphatase
MSTLHVVGAAIVQDCKCLVAQRGEAMSLAGKWEFPGGKVEVGESPTAALAREIAEELGLQVTVAQLLGTGTAAVGERTIRLDVYAATIASGQVALREHAQVAWASVDELEQFDWAEADVPCVAPVKEWLRLGAPSDS